MKPKKAKKWKKLVPADAPVLRQAAEPIDVQNILEYPDLPQLVNDMFWLQAQHRGIGLAAPQVGVGLRVVVIHLGERIAMINPKIVKHSDETSKNYESCLSFPGLRRYTERYKHIDVEYVTTHGNTITRCFSELQARCIQHELDHLNGRVLPDYPQIKEPTQADAQKTLAAMTALASLAPVVPVPKAK